MRDDLGRVDHAAAVRALDAANGATEAAPPTGQQVLAQSPEDTTPGPAAAVRAWRVEIRPLVQEAQP